MNAELAQQLVMAGRGCVCESMVGQKDEWMGKSLCTESLWLVSTFLRGPGEKLAKGNA